MRRYSLPIWFRAAFAALFTVLFVGYLLVRGGGAPAAFARSLIERAAPRIQPVLDTDAALARQPRAQSLAGAYILNGMRVEYRTYRVPVSAVEVVERFENAFRKTGYVTKRILVQGQPTLVALHPKTKVMLTVRLGRDARGTTVRLAQQNLSELRSDFKAQIPEIPLFPGGEGNTLVESADGTPSRSLTFLARNDGDFVARYYDREMVSRGWTRRPSLVLASSPLKVLFFAKEGRECSLMLIPTDALGSTIAMVSVSG
jgi:hypothetical protein